MDQPANCERIICVELTPLSEKSAILGSCLNGTTSNCIRLLPGERGCISLEVPSLPITDWYKVDVKIISVGTSITSTFTLNGIFIEPATGRIMTVGIEDEVRNGGCYPKHDTTLWTNNDEFFIGATFITGVGGK